MANEANYVDQNGNTRRYTALEARDKGLEECIFSCCGKDSSGRVCNAPMKITKTIESPWFYLSCRGGLSCRGESHILGCPYNNTARVARIKNLDRTGKNTTPEQIFENFEKSSFQPPRRGVPVDRTGGDIIDDGDEPPTKEDLPIKNVKRDPRHIGELYDLLSDLASEVTYAGKKVGEIFVDDRSMHSFRENPDLLNDAVALIICNKTKEYTSLLPYGKKGDIFLRDGFDYPDNGCHMFFCLTSLDNDRKDVRETILNTDTKRFAVFSRWVRIVSQDYILFRSKPIKKTHILALEGEYSEK